MTNIGTYSTKRTSASGEAEHWGWERGETEAYSRQKGLDERDRTGIRWSEKQSEQRGLRHQERGGCGPATAVRSDDSFGDLKKVIISLNSPV